MDIAKEENNMKINIKRTTRNYYISWFIKWKSHYTETKLTEVGIKEWRSLNASYHIISYHVNRRGMFYVIYPD